MEQKWVRECQECGNIQSDNEPNEVMSFFYANRKCKKCKSESLDYGKYERTDEEENEWYGITKNENDPLIGE